MSFGGDLKKFSSLVEARQTDVLRMAANEVYNSVSVGSDIVGSGKGTPVDIGNAQNSWRVEDGDAPATGRLEKNHGPEIGLAARASLASMRLGDIKSIIGGAIYIARLEDGHSKQNQGWVALTRAAWPRIVQHFVASVK